MERGAGRYWTEEEIKALLSVWSEKNIRKQLRQTLRNKGIFIYIAKRLQELGVSRDWKQCRAKYKNLKYEYRTVKYAQNSGEGGAKTMRFLQELGEILKDEPGTLSSQEGGGGPGTHPEVRLEGSSTPTGRRASGEISAPVEDEDDDVLEDPLVFASRATSAELGHPRPLLDPSNSLGPIPCVAIEGGKHWTVEEVRALVHVWSDKNIQKQLEGTVRNKCIFEHIASLLQNYGVDRDWKQCRTKYKNLKHEFKMAKKAQASGNTNKMMKFFHELDSILVPKAAGQSDIEEQDGSACSKDDRLQNGSSETPEEIGEEDSVSNVSEDQEAPEVKKESVDKELWVAMEDNAESNIPEEPEATYIKEEEDDVIDLGCPLLPPDPNPSNQPSIHEAAHGLLYVPSMVNEGGKHWSVEEIRALINVWSDPNIQRQLKSTLRNKGIFEHIAAMIQNYGIDRDWKQCRTKYKNLKHEYKLVKQSKGSGNPSKMMHFFTELDAILGPKERGTFNQSDVEESGGTLWAYSRKHNNSNELCEDMHEDDSISSISEEPGTSSVKKESPDLDSGCSGQHLESLGRHIYSPTISNESARNWTVEEVNTLIQVWSDKTIQAQLQGTVRNKSIFEHIATILQGHGIDRDWKQCRTKYKNLKYEYKMVKKAQLSGDTSRTHRFFEQLDAILGHKTAGPFNHCDRAEKDDSIMFINRRIQHHSSDDDSLSTTSEDTTGTLTAKNLPKDDNRKHLDQSLDSCRIISFNDAATGRHWNDQEVKALIHVWSDEKIRQQLEGATRNKEIFEEIASRLLEFGIDRDWKQCRTKYKNLKYEYHAFQKETNCLGSQKKVMKFYDEVDSILRRKPLLLPHWATETTTVIPTIDNSGMENQVHTLSADWLFLPVSAVSEENKEDGRRGTGSRIELSSSLNHNDESSMRKMDEMISSAKRKGSTCEYPDPVKKKMSENIAQRTANPVYHVFEKSFDNQKKDYHGYSRTLSELSRTQMQVCRFLSKMESASELKVGKKLAEGKTKEVYELPDLPGYVLMQSKDQITAGNMAKKDQLEGKALISNKTTSCIFKLLQEAGIKSAFVKKHSDTAFIAAHCEMIPIEWVCRRIATGSFLKRNPGVKEGYKFYPPKLETFFKDDANNDPEWSEAQMMEAKFVCAGLEIGQAEIDIMNRSTLAIFEILEKAWATQDCTLVDMKVEFGVDVIKREIVLADVIDNDSWRLWPAGDRSQQKDKQVYRDLKEVTPEALQMVKRNFEWVANKVELLLESKNLGRVVVLMGSISDLMHCEKIKKSCANYGIPCELRVTSAHKGPDETLRIKAEYEGDGIPTVFVAVAGRSNGLGPVMSGNTAYPVINCPPLTADWGSQDVWSSLRMPSGLGCSTVLSPEAAAQFAAQIFGLTNHLVWSKLRASTLNTWISLKQADKKLRECSM